MHFKITYSAYIPLICYYRKVLCVLAVAVLVVLHIAASAY